MKSLFVAFLAIVAVAVQIQSFAGAVPPPEKPDSHRLQWYTGNGGPADIFGVSIDRNWSQRVIPLDQSGGTCCSDLGVRLCFSFSGIEPGSYRIEFTAKILGLKKDVEGNSMVFLWSNFLDGLHSPLTAEEGVDLYGWRWTNHPLAPYQPNLISWDDNSFTVTWEGDFISEYGYSNLNFVTISFAVSSLEPVGPKEVSVKFLDGKITGSRWDGKTVDQQLDFEVRGTTAVGVAPRGDVYSPGNCEDFNCYEKDYGIINTDDIVSLLEILKKKCRKYGVGTAKGLKLARYSNSDYRDLDRRFYPGYQYEAPAYLEREGFLYAVATDWYLWDINSDAIFNIVDARELLNGYIEAQKSVAGGAPGISSLPSELQELLSGSTSTISSRGKQVTTLGKMKQR